MGLPAAEIDAAITPALREIVQTFGLDRSTLTEFSPDLGRMRFTHSWAVDGVAPVARWISVTEVVPWALERCKAGLPIVFDHIDDLPQEAERRQGVLAADRAQVAYDDAVARRRPARWRLQHGLRPARARLVA